MQLLPTAPVGSPTTFSAFHTDAGGSPLDALYDGTGDGTGMGAAGTGSSSWAWVR